MIKIGKLKNPCTYEAMNLIYNRSNQRMSSWDREEMFGGHEEENDIVMTQSWKQELGR